ncbi:MAG: dihydropteroate synthase [Bacteroidota bacterium]
MNPVFNTPNLLNVGGRLLDLQTPKVMGILNVTDDSFYDGGKFTHTASILRQAGKLIRDGADIVDIGGQSTRPGAKHLSEKAELRRVLPAVKSVLDKFPEAILSVDTWYSEVAGKCVEAGVAMVNDVSAGKIDTNMYKTLSKLKVPYVLMHMKGRPGNMQVNPRYRDVTTEVADFLLKEVSRLRKLGVVDIVVDPGFGFGKTIEHNFQLLKNLNHLKLIGCPILAGLSRKSMIYKTLDINSKNALNGTTALNMVALMNGAKILRVHDAKEANEAIMLFNKMY